MAALATEEKELKAAIKKDAGLLEGKTKETIESLSDEQVINSKCLAYQFKLPEMIHTFQVNSQGITSDNTVVPPLTLSPSFTGNTSSKGKYTGGTIEENKAHSYNMRKTVIGGHPMKKLKELVEKYAMPKTSIYRKRDDALKKLKKILGNT